jgi:hypothetical protein
MKAPRNAALSIRNNNRRLLVVVVFVIIMELAVLAKKGPHCMSLEELRFLQLFPRKQGKF